MTGQLVDFAKDLPESSLPAATWFPAVLSGLRTRKQLVAPKKHVSTTSLLEIILVFQFGILHPDTTSPALLREFSLLIELREFASATLVNMLIEEQRYIHEDLERLEQGIADRLRDEPKQACFLHAKFLSRPSVLTHS